MRIGRSLATLIAAVGVIGIATVPASGAATKASVAKVSSPPASQARQASNAPVPGRAIQPAEHSRRAPFVRRPTGGFQHFQRATRRGAAPTVIGSKGTKPSTTRSSSGPATSRAQHTASPLVAPPAPTLVTSFQGEAQSNAIATWGSDQGVLPPDPNLAVGLNDVVEAANSALYFFKRDGTPEGSADINLMVAPIPGATRTAVTDPRVLYDRAADRFLFTVLVFDPGGCGNYVALLRSDSGSPLGGWHGFQLSMIAPPGPAGGAEEGDQPGLGISDNVVAVTWNYFDCISGSSYGSQADVVQTTDLLNLTPTVNSTAAFFGGPLGLQPANSLSSTAVQYIVYNNSDPIQHGGVASIGVFGVSGAPELGTVSIAETDEPITASITDMQFTTTPAPQAGTSTTLQTDDNRYLSAVWQGNDIWTAGTTNCDNTAGAPTCLDIIDVTADASGNVTNATTIAGTTPPFVGVSGSWLFYPSVSVDSAGRAFVVADESSATTPESVVVAGIVGGTISGFTTLHTSANVYTPGGNPARWGDYSGAAQDPSHPTDVWVASEDTDNNVTINCPAHQCWNTFIGRYTYSAPTIFNLTPAAGPTAGGQTVVANGSDFLPGFTAKLGGTSVTGITAVTPDSFRFTTPSNAAGLVFAQVTTALGTSPSGVPGAGYIYAALAAYAPLAPARLYDTRQADCVNASCGSADAPLGPGETRTVTIVGSGTNQSLVPATATAVVLNVTAVSGTDGSYFTVFPNGTGQPLASNLNFAPGENIANLVTVALGQNVSGGDSHREVQVFNALGSVNLVIDVEGYFATGLGGHLGQFHPIPPLRVCDTRAGQPANNCNQGGAATTDQVIGPNSWRQVTVAGPHAGVPPGKDIPGDGSAEAVVLNLTGVFGDAPTFFTVVPTSTSGTCPSGAPSASNLNLSALTNQPNRGMVPLGPHASGGNNTDVCVYNSQGTYNFILDANGWFGITTASVGTQYQTIGPARICDTRSGTGTECSGHTLGAQVNYNVPIAGVGGIPASAPTPLAVIMNVTAVFGSTSTFLTIYPAATGSTPPNASDLNAPAQTNIPNLDVVQLGVTPSAGVVTIFNSQGSIDAIFDVDGWFQ